MIKRISFSAAELVFVIGLLALALAADSPFPTGIALGWLIGGAFYDLVRKP